MTTWTSASASATTWSSVNRSFGDLWADWESFTWGELEDAGVTWAAMAGDTFADVTPTATTWTSVL